MEMDQMDSSFITPYPDTDGLKHFMLIHGSSTSSSSPLSRLPTPPPSLRPGRLIQNHDALRLKPFQHNTIIYKPPKIYPIILFALATNTLISHRNPIKAFKLFLKSASMGYHPALSVIGFYMEFGILGFAPNFIVAQRLYTMAARRGCEFGMARLAFLKTHGRPGIIIDHLEAEQWRYRLSKQGDGSLPWLMLVAESDVLPAAQFCISLCYYNGIAYKENDETAFIWCYRAAKMGHAGAQNVLGNLFVEREMPDHALQWYKRAAIQREAAALYNIGTLYERGLAVPQSDTDAFKWYKEAAALGSINAQNVLGIFYEQAIGTMQDAGQAVKWYTESAMQGHPHAQYNLARCYHDGFGVLESQPLAFHWFSLASSQNHSLSHLSLAISHEFGIGTHIAPPQVYLPLYLEAAKQGQVIAVRRLSMIVASDLVTASRGLISPLQPKPTHKFRTGIWSLPQEVLEHILSYLNPAGILTKRQELNILQFALNRKTLSHIKALTFHEAFYQYHSKYLEAMTEDGINSQLIQHWGVWKRNVSGTGCDCTKRCEKIDHYMQMYHNHSVTTSQ